MMQLLSWIARPLGASTCSTVLRVGQCAIAVALSALIGGTGALANSAVCFERTYSADHLRRHPKQRLTRVRLDLSVKPDDPDRPVAPEQPREGFDDADVSLVTRMRQPGHSTWGKGGCRKDGNTLVCKLECDTGQFTLSGTGATRRLEFESLALSGCGELDDLRTGDDDDRFVILRPMPPSRCLKDVMGAQEAPE